MDSPGKTVKTEWKSHREIERERESCSTFYSRLVLREVEAMGAADERVDDELMFS